MDRRHFRPPTPAIALALAAAPGLLAGPAAAQEPSEAGGIDVSGIVVDVDTGAPIAGALVELPDLDRQTLTDGHGRFVLRGLPAGERSWRISMLGYATWEERTAVRHLEFLRIGLLPKPIVLERIRVTVDRLETRRRLAPLSVTAVERAELLRSTWGDAVSLARSRIPYTAGPCPGSLTGKGLYMPDVPWEFCVRYRGHTVRPAVWIDERPAALEELVMYHPAELYAMEFYGAGLTAAGRGPIVPQIRVYTVRFVERGGRLRPLWF